MKVEFKAIFNLPESFAACTQDELRIAFYDEVVRVLHKAHVEHVLDYKAVQREVGEFADGHATLKAAEEQALMWARITDLPEWTVTPL